MKLNILLPQDIYMTHLEIVNDIRFTRREIDIIAYLLSGKSAKTIATCLSITPKTIEAHMRNIMIKVECNSRDGIIDFVEKSKKLPFLKEHYLSLLIQAFFEEQLLKINALLTAGHPNCMIVCWQNQNTSLVHYLERHLKLIGIKINLETREGRIFIKDPINNTESWKTKFHIYVVPEAMVEQGKKVEKELASFIEKIREAPNSIVALLPGKDGKNDIFQDFNNAKYIHYLKQENYYDFVFAALKRMLPTIDLEQFILDFKNYSVAICGTPKTIPQISPQEEKLLLRKSLIYQLIKPSRDFFNITRTRKKLFYVGGALSTGVLYILFSSFIGNKESTSPELDYNISARADLNIPTQSVFLDRPYLMERIDKKLGRYDAIQTVALTGMGGVGKTTLARHYARSQNASVVWEFNAGSKEDLNDSFEEFAETLSKTEEEKEKLRGFRDIKDAEERKRKIILLVREKLKHIPDWILIYDNVAKFADIQNHFPYDPSIWGRGKVILITRDNNIKNNNNISEAIQIGELSPEEKLALFTKIMTTGNSGKFLPTQNEETKQFLNDIPPFPLDVSIAAYYLKATNIPYRTYLEKLTQYDKDFESVQQTLLEDASDYTKTRYGIITLSLQYIINSHKDFKDLLLFISLIDSLNIPRDLLDKYKTTTIVDNFIYNLKKHSFITNEAIPSSGSTPVFSIHRSTQAIALAYLTQLLNSEKDKHFIERIGKVFKNYVAEMIDQEDFTKMSLLIRHGEVFLSHSNLLTDFIIAYIGVELGNVYSEQGNYEKAKKLFDRSIAIYKKNFHEKHLEFAQALGCLGCFYSDQGSYEKAKQQFEESLDVYKKNSYENHPYYARTLGWLGNVYREQGNYKKAKELFEKNLIIYKKNSYGNHPWFAQALGRLGSIYREQCNYEKAKQLLEESLVIYKKNAYESNPWFAQALAWLGSVYRDLGNYEKGKELLEESLAIYKKNSHENQPWFAWTLVWLGNLYKEQGNYEKAKQLLEESLIIYKKNSYENHPWFARALAGLGSVYREEGNHENAKQFFEKSLVVYRKNSYENHPWFARTLEHLGNIYREQGNYEKAKQCLEESLVNYKKNHFENHPWFALVLARLGSVYKDLNNYEKAKELLELSFQTYEKIYGKDHIDVAPVIMNLGQVCMLKNDVKTAEGLINKALKIFQTKKYVESYMCLECLSDLYLKRASQAINKEDSSQSENFKKQAAEYLKQALQVIQAHFPKDSPHIARIEAKLKWVQL